MLVLTRKVGETIVIGNGLRVTVSGVSGNRVKIAIDAPKECPIRRAEIAVPARPQRQLHRSEAMAVASH